MKTYHKYITLAALALGFTACTQEEIAPQQYDIVKIASACIATEAETRVNTLGDGASFEDGDQILVVSSSRQDKNQGTYTYNGSTWSLTEGMLLYAASGTNDFTAYYPATASFTLPTDQSDEAKIKFADRMIATATGVEKGGTVALNFIRQNAKVTITPSLASEYAGKTISAMTIQGVTPYKSSSAYTAILEPSNGFSVSVTVNGNTLTATSTQELVAGKHYTLYLTVGKNAASVNVNVAKVADWSTGATLTPEVAEEGMVIPYLTFTSNEQASLTVLCSGNYTLDESLQYSVGGAEWSQLPADTKIEFGPSRKLRIRGKSATGTATDIENYARFSFTGGIYCSGDIRTLVDYENYLKVNTGSARFCKLFSYNNSQNNSCIASSPELPATILATDCYRGMFSNSDLFTAPALPATTLSAGCYRDMFSGCKALGAAPALPATTLASGCYRSMFSACLDLQEAPVLPATTLAKECYRDMFYWCQNLQEAPALPATILADNCYSRMFDNCLELNSAPELPALTLAKECYSGMFFMCPIQEAPVLPATTLAEGCYRDMFCLSGLRVAPVLPATTLVKGCYNGMFGSCCKMNNVTMLATDISAEGCLDGWLFDVSSTGTFTKAATMNSLPTGESGIPSGWTVQNYGN